MIPTEAVDELAQILQAATKAPCPIAFWSTAYTGPTGYGDLFAKAIFAAGYRKPRTITTVEELDALPFETVIRDADECVLERWGDMEESGWVTVMVTSFVPRDQIALPATVLFDPSQP